MGTITSKKPKITVTKSDMEKLPDDSGHEVAAGGNLVSAIVASEESPFAPIEKPAKQTKKRISNADFVRAYIAHSDYTSLAKSLGMAEASVRIKAGALRGLGVHLQKYERKKQEVDVAALNKLLSPDPESQKS